MGKQLGIKASRYLKVIIAIIVLQNFCICRTLKFFLFPLEKMTVKMTEIPPFFRWHLC